MEIQPLSRFKLRRLMKKDPRVQISLTEDADSSGCFLTENRELLENVAAELFDEVWPAWRDHRVLQISLKIVGAGEMAKINAKFRNVDEPTDVLTFPLFEKGREFAPPHLMIPLPLGDILLCPPVIRANAKEHAVSEESETALVLFHGLLHLLAWDHDSAQNRERMWKVQERYREIFLRMPARRMRNAEDKI